MRVHCAAVPMVGDRFVMVTHDHAPLADSIATVETVTREPGTVEPMVRYSMSKSHGTYVVTLSQFIRGAVCRILSVDEELYTGKIKSKS